MSEGDSLKASEIGVKTYSWLDFLRMVGLSSCFLIIVIVYLYVITYNYIMVGPFFEVFNDMHMVNQI